MEGILRVLSGPNVGACFVLKERTRMGRATDADIQLDDPQVSRQHARITRQADGSFALFDLRSTPGTTVNGAPVRKKVLQPHDVIAIGLSRYSFEVGTDVATAASFANKARGFATLRPTLSMPVVSVDTPAPPVERRKRRRTQRRIPAVRESEPVAARQEQPVRPQQGSDNHRGGAENLLDSILGPKTDVVLDRSGEAANEDSGPKPAAADSEIGSAADVLVPAEAPPAAEAAPASSLLLPAESRPDPASIPVPSVPEHRVSSAAPDPPLGEPSPGAPTVVPVTDSAALGRDLDPQVREAALSTLRDVLDYRALRLAGLRGESMDDRAKARLADLSTRLLVDTHGLPSSRRFLRQPCPLPATLTQRDGELSRTFEVRLDDLSAGGARLSMVDPSVRVGDEVWIAFDLAALFSFGQKVVFRSRVVWTSGRIGATGLMFGGNARFVETVEAAIATG